jgi:hypothetical protein
LLFLRARYYNPADGRFQSRDTWEGNIHQPVSLNKWTYANANPLTYIDPSGNEPISIGGAALALGAIFARGAIPGAIAGAAFGCWSYELALTGQCGCELQQEAMMMSKGEWTGVYALTGGLVGGIVSLATITPLTTVIVGGAMVNYSVKDIIHVIDIVYNEGVGWTSCNIVRAGIDVAAFLFGAGAIVKGVRAWRASGSVIKWNAGGSSAVQELYNLSRDGKGPGVREVPGENAQSWFYRIADNTTVRPHRNPIVAQSGGLEAIVKGTSNALVFYRPKTSSGNPALEINNVPGFLNWKFHFPSK